MNESTITAIFAAAAGATGWQRSNLGLSARVPHEGQDWTVRLPQGNGKAYISGSSGYGGETATFVEATWAQTFPIVDAALAATRVH